MTFLLPDNILENLTCDNCYKYLSVGPVKSTADRQQVCGRCTHLYPNGVISKYDVIGKNTIFKCINRFDGCNILLTYEDALKHESECLSNLYPCPVCCDTTEMPTYELINHVKKKHHHSYLKTTYFKRRVEELKDVKNAFFVYLKHDYVFFIGIEETFELGLILSAFYIGRDSKLGSIQQKYIVHLDGQNIHEGAEIECLHLKEFCTSSKVEYTILGHRPPNSMLTVNFEFYVPFASQNFLDKRIPGSLPLKELLPPTIVTPINEVFRYFEFKTIHDFDYLPKFKANQKFAGVKKSKLKISPCAQKIIVCINNIPVKINPMCYLCSNISKSNIYILVGVESFVCTLCALLNGLSYDIAERKMPNVKQIFKIFKASCMWKCGKFLDITTDWLGDISQLQMHEIMCPNAPSLECPELNCCFKDSRFEILENHLKTVHRINLFCDPLTLSALDIKDLCIKLNGQCYVLLRVGNQRAFIHLIILESSLSFVIRIKYDSKDISQKLKTVVFESLQNSFGNDDKFVIHSGSVLWFQKELFPIKIHFLSQKQCV